MTNDKGVKETYFEDLLRLERTATTSYKEHATAADPSAEHNADGGELPSKRLSFFFRKSIEGEEIRTPRHSTHYGHSDGMEVYHTIQGRRRRGLIIDPGAANGLVGSETLRDLLQHCDLSEQVKSSITWGRETVRGHWNQWLGGHHSGRSLSSASNAERPSRCMLRR